ncbi:hypothetical protein C8R47DRAFT_1066948 [Mycena vitilis]|nr:hypothetical protein C8R47DRAFT_1066948 [Mycena vitilis]
MFSFSLHFDFLPLFHLFFILLRVVCLCRGSNLCTSPSHANIRAKTTSSLLPNLTHNTLATSTSERVGTLGPTPQPPATCQLKLVSNPHARLSQRPRRVAALQGPLATSDRECLNTPAPLPRGKRPSRPSSQLTLFGQTRVRRVVYVQSRLDYGRQRNRVRQVRQRILRDLPSRPPLGTARSANWDARAARTARETASPAAPTSRKTRMTRPSGTSVPTTAAGVACPDGSFSDGNNGTAL